MNQKLAYDGRPWKEAAQLGGDTDGGIILIGFHKDHLAVAELQGKAVMS